ncbi:hypothetical protein B0H21DRAFT_740545 [Amylocystis lapponica]|nr:hypothetical protein B0H21DRAFT_740545 [Amylocystis lapponica]
MHGMGLILQHTAMEIEMAHRFHSLGNCSGINFRIDAGIKALFLPSEPPISSPVPVARLFFSSFPRNLLNAVHDTRCSHRSRLVVFNMRVTSTIAFVVAAVAAPVIAAPHSYYNLVPVQTQHSEPPAFVHAPVHASRALTYGEEVQAREVDERSWIGNEVEGWLDKNIHLSRGFWEHLLPAIDRREVEARDFDERSWIGDKIEGWLGKNIPLHRREAEARDLDERSFWRHLIPAIDRRDVDIRDLDERSFWTHFLPAIDRCVCPLND